MFRITEINSGDVRVPAVAPGTAVRVNHYGVRPKAVVVNPEDFERMCRLEELVGQVSELEPLEFTALAVEMHHASEAGDEVDLESLGATLDLR